MKKRMFAMLFALCMIVSLLPFGAAAADMNSGTCGTNLKWSINTETDVLTISGTGAMSDFTTTNTSNKNTAPWRYWALTDHIRTLEIKSGVTSIGKNAFVDCHALTDVRLPNTLRKIDVGAFTRCGYLKTITIPKSVTEIAPGAFSLSGLEQITIPESIVTIRDGAFAFCSNLARVSLPDNLTTIEQRAFANCDSLEQITIPDHVTFIGYQAFALCDKLSSVFLPTDLKTLEAQAFISTPLTSIEIPSGVSSIGESTFNSCKSLSEISLPAGIKEIGKAAFDYCNALRDVYFAGSKAQWQAISVKESNDPLLQATIHFNSSAPVRTTYCDWSTSNQWKFYNVISNPKSATDYDAAEHGYFITGSDFAKLTRNLSAYDAVNIDHYTYEDDNGQEIARLYYNVDGARSLYREWAGSCLGMSTLSVLMNRKAISSADLGMGTGRSAHDIAISDQTRSTINFYQNFWSLAGWQNNVEQFMGQTIPQQFAVIESALKRGNPVVLSFEWVRYEGSTPKKDSAHAVVVYGVEVGNYTNIASNGVTRNYDKRLVIYDCAEKQTTYLFYSTGAAPAWAYPTLNIVCKKTYPRSADVDETNFPHDSNGTLQFAISDLRYLNGISYIDGSLSSGVANAKLGTARLYAYSDQTYQLRSDQTKLDFDGIRYQKVQGDGMYARAALQPNYLKNGASGRTNVTVFLSERSGYTIESKCALSYGFGDHDRVAFVHSVSPGVVTFGSNGSVDAKTTQDQTMTVTLTGNQTSTTWNTIQIVTKGKSGVKVAPANTGAVVSGTALSGAKVTVTKDGKTVQSTMQTSEKAVDIQYQNGKITIQKHQSNPFRDVPSNDYFFDPVLWALNHDPQITDGTSDTTFSPDATCTRGQVVTFLWRAMGCDEPTKTDNPFRDVSSGDYFYKAVLWAVEKGITDGTSATTFSPNDPCTRAHVVTFLWRAENKPAAGSNNPFKDVSRGAYYFDPVLWAVEKGITDGTSDTTFSPNADCTRGQIVTFLYRDMK